MMQSQYIIDMSAGQGVSVTAIMMVYAYSITFRLMLKQLLCVTQVLVV